MGTHINITDLRSSTFDNIEQQDSGDFLRHQLDGRLAGIKQLFVNKLVESIKCSNCDYRPNLQEQKTYLLNFVFPKIENAQ